MLSLNRIEVFFFIFFIFGQVSRIKRNISGRDWTEEKCILEIFRGEDVSELFRAIDLSIRF